MTSNNGDDSRQEPLSNRRSRRWKRAWDSTSDITLPCNLRNTTVELSNHLEGRSILNRTDNNSVGQEMNRHTHICKPGKASKASLTFLHLIFLFEMDETSFSSWMDLIHFCFYYFQRIFQRKKKSMAVNSMHHMFPISSFTFLVQNFWTLTLKLSRNNMTIHLEHQNYINGIFLSLKVMIQYISSC